MSNFARAILLIVLPLGGIIGLNSLLGGWRESLLTQLGTAREQIALWTDKQTQLQQDVIAAKELRRRLPANPSPALYVPIDERAALRLADSIATLHRLKHPEFGLRSEALPDADNLTVVQKRLSLKAAAPHEGYVLALLQDLSNRLPGKLQPVRLTVTRDMAARSPTTGLALECEWLWLQQGSKQTDAEAP
jgi:hypothetical protein